jgi:hypothetical protein
MKLFFGCLQPATTGGETPIADSRRVLQRLAPATRERFREGRVLYRRTYGLGMGVSWRKAFQAADRPAAEARCRELGIEFEWRSGEDLHTWQRGDAIVRHPRTNEEVWFNHGFFFNPRAIEPEEIRELLLSQPDEELSTSTLYGDGSPIPPETIEEIRAAYAAEAVSFPWQAGDVLLIDNMLTAHARRPYGGPRRVRVAMAEPLMRGDLKPV